MTRTNPTLLSRRDLVKVTVAGLFGMSHSGWLEGLATRAEEARAQGKRPKSCILVFSFGGVSQLETLDMKPDGPEQVRGEFKPIATGVSGIQVCEHMPKLAQQMRELAVIRSMYTFDGGPVHDAAQKGMVDCFFQGARKPRKGIGVGAVVSSALAPPNFGLPTNVLMDNLPGRPPVEQGEAGFLGAQHGQFHVDPFKGIECLKPLTEMSHFDRRDQVLRRLDQLLAEEHRAPVIDARRSVYEGAVTLMHSKKSEVFNLDSEPAALRDAYGRHHFGTSCLLARRLVEVGVPFIEVSHNNWDHHGKIFPELKGHMLPQLDSGLPTLIRDLKDRGLLDTTLVVWMGEMGRTPQINKGAGRDHFSQAWSIALAGAGLKTGQVIGRTSADAMRVEDRPVSFKDLMATILLALGIDPASEYSVRDGRPYKELDEKRQMAAGLPVRLLDADAKPIQELLGRAS